MVIWRQHPLGGSGSSVRSEKKREVWWASSTVTSFVWIFFNIRLPPPPSALWCLYSVSTSPLKVALLLILSKTSLILTGVKKKFQSSATACPSSREWRWLVGSVHSGCIHFRLCTHEGYVINQRLNKHWVTTTATKTTSAGVWGTNPAEPSEGSILKFLDPSRLFSDCQKRKLPLLLLSLLFQQNIS